MSAHFSGCSSGGESKGYLIIQIRVYLEEERLLNVLLMVSDRDTGSKFYPIIYSS